MEAEGAVTGGYGTIKSCETFKLQEPLFFDIMRDDDDNNADIICNNKQY